MKKRPVIDPESARAVAEARRRSDEAQDAVAKAAFILEEAGFEAQRANEDAEALYAEVYAEELSWKAAEAAANHDAHLEHCDRVNTELSRRHAAHPRKRPSGRAHIELTEINTTTIDGRVHKVVDRTELLLGHKGHNTVARKAVRLKLACGMTADSPFDELLLDAFKQGSDVDCPRCLEAK